MTDPNKAPNTYTMNGIPVQFPHKAYPSQMAMMAKIIQSLKNAQNCLLESPTGNQCGNFMIFLSLRFLREINFGECRSSKNDTFFP